MNKYLLLRDNKQSGPYTVPEIIAKGIKPYDLVWLEGKSAAWRYPSEVEELKAHAPAVEEQPFDRFYKKPEAILSIHQEGISPFDTPAATETVRKKIDASPKKVYVNFPGGLKKVPVYQETKTEQPVVSLSPQAEYKESATPFPAPPPSDRKLLNTVMVACCILVLIISALIINYSNQRTNIRQLNNMVRQMEKRQGAENQAAGAVPSDRVIPVAETIPAATVQQEVSHPAASAPVANKTGGEKPAFKPVTTSSEVQSQLKSVIKERQDLSAGQIKAAAVQPKESEVENLFNLVSVKPNNYRTGVLGGVSNLQFVLTNNSSHELQKVAVEIKYLSPEKKVIKTQTVYFEKVSPGSQPILDVPKSNRGVSIDYAITDIKS